MKNVNIKRVQNIEDVNRELMNIKRLLENTPVLYGNDSPQGKVIASVSSVYHQLNSTGIENIWVKATGDKTTDGWKPFSTIPAGVMWEFGGETIPSGFLLCDGTSYLRTKYPSLFTAIGTAWGAADSDHFNIPSREGLFARGVDNGKGVDPDAASRTAIKPGGNTGDKVGSVQDDDFESHLHVRNWDGSWDAQAETAYTSGSYPAPWFSATGSNHNKNTNNAGGNETRPINAYVNYIIKY